MCTKREKFDDVSGLNRVRKLFVTQRGEIPLRILCVSDKSDSGDENPDATADGEQFQLERDRARRIRGIHWLYDDDFHVYSCYSCTKNLLRS